MMRAHEDVSSRDRHVPRQLTLDCEVALVGIGILKVLLHVQRERKYWTEARERLIVKSLSTELILRACGNSRRHNTRRTNRRNWSTRRTHGALEHLHCVEQSGLRWTARRQDALLLLHRVGNVRVEGDCQQGMVVEKTEGSSYRRLSIAPGIPCNGEPRRPIVLVAWEALLHAHRILRCLNIRSGERDSGERVAQRKGRDLFGLLIVITNTIVERQVAANFPGVLRKESHWPVADAAHRIAEPLNKIGRETETVLLHGREVG